MIVHHCFLKKSILTSNRQTGSETGGLYSRKTGYLFKNFTLMLNEAITLELRSRKLVLEPSWFQRRRGRDQQ